MAFRAKRNPNHHHCSEANCLCSRCGHPYEDHCWVEDSTECKYEDGCPEYTDPHNLDYGTRSPLREAVLSAIAKQTVWKRKSDGNWVREIAGGFITAVVKRPITGFGTIALPWRIYINGTLIDRIEGQVTDAMFDDAAQAKNAADTLVIEKVQMAANQLGLYNRD